MRDRICTRCVVAHQLPRARAATELACQAASALRDGNSSFRSILATCVCTVRRDRNSWSAISWLDRPAAIKPAISPSRVVSGPAGASAGSDSQASAVATSPGRPASVSTLRRARHRSRPTLVLSSLMRAIPCSSTRMPNPIRSRSRNASVLATMAAAVSTSPLDCASPPVRNAAPSCQTRWCISTDRSRAASR